MLRMPAARVSGWMTLIVVAGLMALAGGCSTVEEEANITIPPVSPTDPAHVAVLHEEPARPHERLGKVTVDVWVLAHPTAGQIADALRQGAARLGADAVMPVYDQTLTQGPVVTSGEFWEGWLNPAELELDPLWSRQVIGVAIKYR